MAKRTAASRLVFVSSVAALAYVNVVSCGGSDSTKHVMDEAGGGEAGDAPASSGGSKAGSATNGGKSGAGGTASSAGKGGTGGSGPTMTPAGGAGGEPEPNATNGGQGGDTTTTPAGGDAGAMSSAGAGGESACDAAAVDSRIVIVFDTVNAEKVTGLAWKNSAGDQIPNVAAYDSTTACNNLAEFFGEAYGAPEGTDPLVVVGGSRGTFTQCGADRTIVSAPNECNFKQVPTTTEYHFYGGAKASQMRVTRTIGFDANTPKFSGTGLRVWQPRVVLATYKTIIYPNAAETAVTTTPVSNCGGDCLTSKGATWSGSWFADIAANGQAIIVLRDPALTAPVDLTINYDSNSQSNLTSFVNLQPQDGWKAPITEVEYLCFADLTSWPQTERDAAQLPAFCGP